MPFKKTLNEMLELVPGSLGAIIADWEGEAVDQVARMDDYDIKILGAHKGIILTRLREALDRVEGGELEEVLIRSDQNHTLVAPLTEDYFLVLTLSPEAMLGRASFALRRCVAQLREEIA
ncbi:MAG: roadblock/LC7 domain-containing protein [Desulfuromonadales bacterium]|nr:roadblock/LC7 domain-containing protein [Desulfuromonadales bacterium]